uniref:RT18C protein n=1 Tax=Echinostoma caproni TaxID=27848 RepID=A0A183A1P7_9TREM
LLPVMMEDPYKKTKKRCFLCKHNIELDYKNVRLLSQFVSPYTGRIYGRHITGLCIPMQKRISTLITRSRQFGECDFPHFILIHSQDSCRLRTRKRYL